MNPFDNTLLRAINGLAGRFPALDNVAVVLTVYAPALFGILFLLLWMVSSRERTRRRRAILQAVVAGVIALLVNGAIAWTYNRLRPFAVLPDVRLLIAHSPGSSFPSDHASGSFAFAASMTQADRAVGRVFWAFAILVGLSRPFVGVHWPTDVLGSLIVGLASAVLVRSLHGPLELLMPWSVRALDRLGFGPASDTRETEHKQRREE